MMMFSYLLTYITYFMALSVSRHIYCWIEGRWMKYDYTGTDKERSGSDLIEFISSRAKENHEKSHSEYALF